MRKALLLLSFTPMVAVACSGKCNGTNTNPTTVIPACGVEPAAEGTPTLEFQRQMFFLANECGMVSDFGGSKAEDADASPKLCELPSDMTNFLAQYDPLYGGREIEVETVFQGSDTILARAFTLEELEDPDATLESVTFPRNRRIVDEMGVGDPFEHYVLPLPAVDRIKNLLALRYSCEGYIDEAIDLASEGELAYSVAAEEHALKVKHTYNAKQQTNMAVVIGTFRSPVIEAVWGGDGNSGSGLRSRYLRLVLWQLYTGGLQYPAFVLSEFDGAFTAFYTASEARTSFQSTLEASAGIDAGMVSAEVRAALGIGSSSSLEGLFQTFRTSVFTPKGESVFDQEELWEELPTPTEISSDIAGTNVPLSAEPTDPVTRSIDVHSHVVTIPGVPKALCNNWRLVSLPDVAHPLSDVYANAHIEGSGRVVEDSEETSGLPSCQFTIQGEPDLPADFRVGSIEVNYGLTPRMVVDDIPVVFVVRGRLPVSSQPYLGNTSPGAAAPSSERGEASDGFAHFWWRDIQASFVDSVVTIDFDAVSGFSIARTNIELNCADSLGENVMLSGSKTKLDIDSYNRVVRFDFRTAEEFPDGSYDFNDRVACQAQFPLSVPLESGVPVDVEMEMTLLFPRQVVTGEGSDDS